MSAAVIVAQGCSGKVEKLLSGRVFRPENFLVGINHTGGLCVQGSMGARGGYHVTNKTMLPETMKHGYMVESLLFARDGHDNDKIDSAYSYCVQFISRMGRAAHQK